MRQRVGLRQKRFRRNAPGQRFGNDLHRLPGERIAQGVAGVDQPPAGEALATVVEAHHADRLLMLSLEQKPLKQPDRRIEPAAAEHQRQKADFKIDRAVAQHQPARPKQKPRADQRAGKQTAHSGIRQPQPQKTPDRPEAEHARHDRQQQSRAQQQPDRQTALRQKNGQRSRAAQHTAQNHAPQRRPLTGQPRRRGKQKKREQHIQRKQDVNVNDLLHPHPPAYDTASRAKNRSGRVAQKNNPRTGGSFGRKTRRNRASHRGTPAMVSPPPPVLPDARGLADCGRHGCSHSGIELPQRRTKK